MVGAVIIRDFQHIAFELVGGGIGWGHRGCLCWRWHFHRRPDGYYVGVCIENLHGEECKNSQPLCCSGVIVSVHVEEFELLQTDGYCMIWVVSYGCWINR